MAAHQVNITDRAKWYRAVVADTEEFHASVVRRLEGPMSANGREAFRGVAAALDWALRRFQEHGCDDIQPDGRQMASAFSDYISTDWLSPVDVPCSDCGAAIGIACSQRPGGPLPIVHKARFDLGLFCSRSQQIHKE